MPKHFYLKHCFHIHESFNRIKLLYVKLKQDIYYLRKVRVRIVTYYGKEQSQVD